MRLKSLLMVVICLLSVSLVAAQDEAQPAEIVNDEGGPVVITGKEAKDVAAALEPDLEPLGGYELTAVAEIEPLIVFFLGQPVCNQFETFRRVEG